MFFIIEGITNEECIMTEKEALASHAAHVAFVNKEIENGRVKLAGPKANGGGGFIILKAEDEEEAEKFIEADPSYISGAQKYNVTPWQIFDIAKGLESIKD